MKNIKLKSTISALLVTFVLITSHLAMANESKNSFAHSSSFTMELAAPDLPNISDQFILNSWTPHASDYVLSVVPRSGETYEWIGPHGSTTSNSYTLVGFGTGDPKTVTVQVRSVKNGEYSAYKTVTSFYTKAKSPDSVSKTTTGGSDYLVANGASVTDIEWYWQGDDAHGTETLFDAHAHNYRVTESGTYYVRAYDADNHLWNPASLAYVYTEPGSTAVTPGTASGFTASFTESAPANFTNYNTVEAYDVLKSGMSDTNIKSGSASNYDVAMNAQYVDGLGRPWQTVSRKASPDQKDMVQVMAYDKFGRQSLQYLPFETSGTNGAIRISPYTDQNTFYNGQFSNETVRYGQTLFDNSPLNRVKVSMAPGNAWAGSRVGVHTDYEMNSIDDGVRKWAIDGSGYPTSAGAFSAGKLSVTETTDEEGHQTRQFTDKLGRVILKQVQKDNQPGTGHGDWLSTYYVYDIYGNLRYVLPPKLVDILDSSWSWNNSTMLELAFKYTYDNRGRMITKVVPGADEVYMVYDKLDRLVMTQDGNQRAKSPDQWTFTKYDELNRPVMTGFVNSNNSRATMQNQADTTSVLNTRVDPLSTTNVLEAAYISLSTHVQGTAIYRAKDYVEFLQGFDAGTAEYETELVAALSSEYTFIQGYYDATFPSLKTYAVAHEILTLNYYDNYDFTTKDWRTDYTGLTGGTNAVTPAKYDHVVGLATGSKVKVLDTPDKWLTTVMFYDDRGRVVQTQGENHLGGEDITTMQYDFSGKVLKSYTKHTNPASSSSTTTILKQYTYDHAGRLLSIDDKLNGATSWKRLVTNTYNARGELNQKKLGNASTPLETLDYKYNIRGWLESINETFVNSGGTSRYFGMTLEYAEGFSKGYRNGNIAGTRWRSQSSSKAKAYGYRYDAVNRLTNGDYTQNESGTTWNTNKANFSTAYTYDDNGNISSLDRWGVVAGTKTLIDDLSYGYFSNSNQLSYVSDVKGDMGQGDFRGNNSTAQDFAYDNNGNMTQDITKGINANDITYNHLNLPAKIEFDNNTSKTISYTYDAAGIKLQKQVNNGGNITTTDYVGGFLYQNDVLQQFAHEEGRVRLSNGNLVYDYFIKDHLGNTRMTLTEEVSVTEYKAAFETGVSSTSGEDIGAYEESVFLNVPATRDASTTHNTSDVPGITDVGVARLNGSVSSRRIGPGKLIAVTAGDQIAVDVDYYHTGGYSSQGTWANTDMLPLIAGVFGGVSGGTGGEQEIYDFFNTGAGNVAFVGSQGSANNVKAYLNVLVFDQDFNYVPSGAFYTQVRNSSGYASLSKTVNLSQGGFVYVYLSNESKADFNVYFDDLNIVHTKGEILQEDHYYPFGMNISALSSTAPLSKPNYYKYGGQLFDDDFNVDLYGFEARTFDPQIGRFNHVDPLADVEHSISINPYHYVANNPMLNIDPDGRDWFVNNNTGQVVFMAGVSEFSYDALADHLNDDAVRNLAGTSGADAWENIGADNMFDSDKYKFSETHDLLAFDSQNGQRFMELNGYAKAYEQEVTELDFTLRDYEFTGPNSTTGGNKEIKSSKVTYKPNKPSEFGVFAKISQKVADNMFITMTRTNYIQIIKAGDPAGKSIFSKDEIDIVDAVFTSYDVLELIFKAIRKK